MHSCYAIEACISPKAIEHLALTIQDSFSEWHLDMRNLYTDVHHQIWALIAVVMLRKCRHPLNRHLRASIPRAMPQSPKKRRWLYDASDIRGQPIFFLSAETATASSRC